MGNITYVRQMELLRLIADDLERGATPLNETFLRENAVNFDECLALADAMATAIRGYTYAPEEVQRGIIIASGVNCEKRAAHLISIVDSAQARNEAIERLSAMNSKTPRDKEPAP